ncbi:RNA polymerase subunit sigma [Kocuria sp. WN036]|uniref:ECF RNA polymerase sigma factor SigK n=1 Tax=Kocuria TaxID=57493 RepID=UPI000BABF8AC|nr:ECF RNA polymerase sigma factor SigK [Kocuria sp. WN036]MCC5784870.1 RNA polymerase subunit sigma [Kocuria sp. CCUG 69068]NVC22269.1 sigma-70 family RNA polymerase sigma factor [Kocuria salina]PAU92212.1 RNA polymerase subunit sigma [Kocuria sp. WN036]
MSTGPTGRSGRAGAPVPAPGRTEQQVELLRRVAGGDEDAFAELYDATSSTVHGLVLRLLRSPELAAEVVQEVYLMAWQQAERFDAGRGTVLAWLCTMAHRRAVDRIRQSQRERDRDQQYEVRRAETPSDSTWSEVEQSLDSEEVRAELGGLSPLQREAVCLVYYRGYSHRQVAEHLDVPLGTAKARIRDGLTNLRSALGVRQ